MVYDTTSGGPITLYVNSEEVKKDCKTGTRPVGTELGELNIGWTPADSNVLIEDEVKIWFKALTENEIKAVYKYEG